MNHDHSTGASAPASVVLDLGADIGALVIYTSTEQCGNEIEISRTGPDGNPDPAAVRTHAAVRARTVQPRPLYGALIPDLPAGRYVVWNRDTPLSTVEVIGGRVAEFEWPARRGPS
jgi:hypothetical protein